MSWQIISPVVTRAVRSINYFIRNKRDDWVMIIGRFQPSNCVSVSSRAVFTLFILLLISAMHSLSSTFFDLFCSARSLLLRCISPARNLSRTSNWFPVLSFFLFTESVKHGNTSKHNLEWFRFFIFTNVHYCASPMEMFPLVENDSILKLWIHR